MGLEIPFFILAVLIIILMVAHSIWVKRKEKSKVFHDQLADRSVPTSVGSTMSYGTNPLAHSNQDQPIREDFVSPREQTFASQEAAHASVYIPTELQSTPSPSAEDWSRSVESIKIRLPESEEAASPVAPQPTYASPVYSSTPTKPKTVLETSVEELEARAANNDNVDLFNQEVRAELEMQSRLGSSTNRQDPAVIQRVAESPAEPKPVAEPVKLITLYVVAPDNQTFAMEQVIIQLDRLDLKYGERQIFHRHSTIDSQSPVIFSVANMEKPGSFDLHQAPQLKTIGLAFFMPITGHNSDLQHFNLLINTVQRFAENMNGFVVNEQYQLFDERSRQQYMARLQ